MMNYTKIQNERWLGWIKNFKLYLSLSGETLVKGEPRPHTRIHLLSRDGTNLASTYSDAEGKYKFEGVREGESYITVVVDPLKRIHYFQSRY